MKEKILIVSILLNLMLMGCFAFAIYKKGGIRFIKRKMGIGQVNADNGYGPYYDQRKSLFEILPRDTNDIIFLGHSLMDGCEWAELFNNPHLKNRGINGELSEGIIKRLDVVMDPPPRKIFVMTGANDIATKMSPEEILLNCRTIMDSFKLKCPATEVYFMSVLPIGRTYDKGAGPVIDQFNTGLEKMTREFGYTYIDLFSLVRDEEGYFDETLSNDGSHLMGEGYLKVMERIKEYV